MRNVLSQLRRFLRGVARRPGRAYERLLDGCGVIAAALILFVAFGTSVDVVVRNLGLGVIPWMLEASEYALAVATFLGAAWVLHLGAHVRVDLMLDNAPRWLGRTMELVADIIGLAVASVLLYYAGNLAIDRYTIGARVIKELIFPEWWIFALIVLAAVLLIAEFALRIRRAFAGAHTHVSEND